MSTAIVLLRGVNVGSKNRVPMRELVQALQRRGMGHPRSYLQSGNIVFDVERVPDMAEQRQLSEAVSTVVEQEFGVITPAVAVTDVRLSTAAVQAVQGTQGRDPKLVHVAFWNRPTTSDGLHLLAQGREKLLEIAAAGAFGKDRLQILQDCAIMDFDSSSRNSKLTLGVLEKHLGVTATARNLRTVTKLAEF